MKKSILLGAVWVSVMFPSSAQAYLDPGTGSMILQAFAAALVTCLVFLHGVRQKIISFFRRGTKGMPPSEEEKNKGRRG